MQKKFKIPEKDRPMCTTSDGTPVEAIVMKSIGKDEHDAADKICPMPPEAYEDKKARGAWLNKQSEVLVKLALVSVNGQESDPLKSDFEKWSEKARGYTLAAYGALNNFKEDDLKAFLDGAEAA